MARTLIFELALTLVKANLYPHVHFRQAPNFDRENSHAEDRPTHAAQSDPRQI